MRRSIISFIGIGCDAGEREGMEAQWRALFLVQEYADRDSLQNLMIKQVSPPHPACRKPSGN